MFLQGQFHIGATTVHGFIPEALRVFWETLQPRVLEMPKTFDDWKEIIDDFHEKCQFPQFFGALDGKQVVMEVML